MEPDNNTYDKSTEDLPVELNNSPQSIQPQQSAQIEPDTNKPDQPNKPGIIVLQWLTYAFWGWTIVALGTLLATTVGYLVNGSSTGGFTPYGIAAVLVLLPISAACDLFYSKYEPVKKTGAASIVMVIHAVIFALLAIGSLIGVVFSAISLATSVSDTKPVYVAIITAFCLSVIYSITFLRTLRPAKLLWLNRVYTALMVMISLVVISLAIIGPVNNERVTKNDRLFTENAPSLKRAIDSYSDKNSALPKSLSDIESKDENVNKLISSQLVQYTPNTKSRSLVGGYLSSKARLDDGDSGFNNGYTYFYELCFDYKKADDSSSSNYNDLSYGNDEYKTYISTYGHEAGKVCYKLETGY